MGFAAEFNSIAYDGAVPAGGAVTSFVAGKRWALVTVSATVNSRPAAGVVADPGVTLRVFDNTDPNHPGPDLPPARPTMPNVIPPLTWRTGVVADGTHSPVTTRTFLFQGLVPTNTYAVMLAEATDSEFRSPDTACIVIVDIDPAGGVHGRKPGKRTARARRADRPRRAVRKPARRNKRR